MEDSYYATPTPGESCRRLQRKGREYARKHRHKLIWRIEARGTELFGDDRCTRCVKQNTRCIKSIDPNAEGLARKCSGCVHTNMRECSLSSQPPAHLGRTPTDGEGAPEWNSTWARGESRTPFGQHQSTRSLSDDHSARRGRSAKSGNGVIPSFDPGSSSDDSDSDESVRVIGSWANIDNSNNLTRDCWNCHGTEGTPFSIDGGELIAEDEWNEIHGLNYSRTEPQEMEVAPTKPTSPQSRCLATETSPRRSPRIQRITKRPKYNFRKIPIRDWHLAAEDVQVTQSRTNELTRTVQPSNTSLVQSAHFQSKDITKDTQGTLETSIRKLLALPGRVEDLERATISSMTCAEQARMSLETRLKELEHHSSSGLSPTIRKHLEDTQKAINTLIRHIEPWQKTKENDDDDNRLQPSTTEMSEICDDIALLDTRLDQLESENQAILSFNEMLFAENETLQSSNQALRDRVYEMDGRLNKMEALMREMVAVTPSG